MVNKKGEARLKFLGIVLGFIVAVIGLNMGLFFIGVSLNQVGGGDGFLFSEKGSLFSEMGNLFSEWFDVGLVVNGSVDEPGSPGGGGSSRCRENWECGVWGRCINGKQIRKCVDLNRCGTVKIKPNETIYCKISVEGDLGIGLVESCDDGIKNQGEVDVDCGGPCPLCVEKPLKEDSFSFAKYIYGVIGCLMILFLIFYFRWRKKESILKKYRSKWGEVLRRKLSI